MKEEIEADDEMEQPQGVAGSDSAETSPDDGPTEEADVAGLTASVATLTRERDELKDVLLRKQAEFENFRKRTQKERSEFVQFAASQVVEGVLDVLDSFELAIREGSDNQNAASLHQGFELIFKQLFDSLERQGLTAVETEGQPFDPHVHEAVSTRHSDDVAEGMVIEELRKGYLLNGRLLRPAMVVVAAGPTADEGDR